MQSNANELSSENNSTRLTDFPLELLLDIYEDLDLRNLANVAKTHPYNWNAAEIIFNHKHSIETFDINGTIVFNGELEEKSVNTHEFNSILNSLEMFGHLITKLKLDYSFFDDQQSEIINKHICKYVANTLNRIELIQFTGESLAGLEPLKNVEIVNLAKGNVSSDGVNFSELFPSVRDLDIACMIRPKYGNFQHHFPHLETIKMEIFIDTDSPEFEQRLRLNPQLRKLWLMHYNWQNLKMISKLLPNLEYLELLFMEVSSDYDDGDIHFENLKFLSIHAYAEYLDRSPIIVSSLEEIKCMASSDRCYDIIMQNKNLKKIKTVKLDGTQLYQIATELPNLEELLMDNKLEIDDVAGVVRFLQTCKKLKKFLFWNWTHDTFDIIATLHERLQDWSSFVEGVYLNFVRN